jgi:hypothetical protein
MRRRARDALVPEPVPAFGDAHRRSRRVHAGVIKREPRRAGRNVVLRSSGAVSEFRRRASTRSSAIDDRARHNLARFLRGRTQRVVARD